MNNNIVMSAQPHKKEQLLKELDLALNRKIQQKYSNNPKSQQIYTHSILKQSINPDQIKVEVKQQTKLYRSKDYFSKSPINSKHFELKKQCSPEISKSKKEAQHLYRATLNKEIHISKPIQTEESQKESYFGNSRETYPSNIHQNVSTKQNLSMQKLKQQNRMLQTELSQLKTCIKELENQSKRLKREQSQYLTLRQQNSSLKRQIDFLRNKVKNSQDIKVKQGGSSQHFLVLAQIMKKLMMQLNINFIDKQWTNQFVMQSLKNVSKGIYKLSEQKNKLNAKINTFDVQTVLAKQSNVGFKKEIQELRILTAEYQRQIQEYQNKMAKIQAQFQQALSQNMRIQAKYRQSYKELQALKKQHKMTIQSYKHRKPKRQTYFKRQTEVPFEEINTLVVSTLNVQTQTTENESKFDIQVNNQQRRDILALQQQILSLQESITQIFLKKSHLQRQLRQCESNLAAKSEQIKQLQSLSLQNRIKIAQYQQKKYHYECYIKQLEAKCAQINHDISNFMPQLKQIQEQNHALRAANAQKDQDIIAKMQAITVLRDQSQQKEEQIALLQRQAKTHFYETQILTCERDRIIKQNARINQFYNKLQNQMRVKDMQYAQQILNTQKNVERTLLSKIESYSQITSLKESQLKSLEAGWKEKERQFLNIIANLAQNNQQFTNLDGKVASNFQVFLKQKNKLKQAVQQIMILNNQLAKKQTQYQTLYNAVQNRMISFQTQSNTVSQTYYQLQLSSERAQQQLVRLKRQNDILSVKNDNLMNQLAVERLNFEKIKIEIGSHQELRKKQEAQINQLKLKKQSLQIFLETALSQVRKKQQSLLALQQKSSDLESNLSHLHENQKSKINQIFMLQERISNLANENRLLFEKYQIFKGQAEHENKYKTEQLSNQGYDIQRLIRQNRQLKTNLSQMDFLSSSKEFNKSDLETKIFMLTQQNKSLSKKYQYLTQQLEVSQRSKQEDRYLNQLKGKQYCLILKNILSNIVEIGDLDNCCSFEYMLEVGADRVINHKKDMRNLQSLKKKELKTNYYDQYQIQNNRQQAEQPRKFNFGIQINSYQEMGPQKFHNGNENDVNVQTAQRSPVNSPRSFIFNLSPNSHVKDREQSRKSRFITQYITPLNQNNTEILK